MAQLQIAEDSVKAAPAPCQGPPAVVAGSAPVQGHPLTIAPTQDCNFQCVYCYEKDQLRHQVVDAGTRDKILEYVTKLAPHIRRLNICWYGGEPLLAQDTIRLSSGTSPLFSKARRAS